jgi:hypothetical protein
MLFSRMLTAGLAITFVLQLCPAGGARAESEAKQVPAGPSRTGKERLGGKASDEQRVDNCKVPLDQRGPKLRPDACANPAGSKR